MAKSVSICGKKNASKALFTIYLYLTQIVHTELSYCHTERSEVSINLKPTSNFFGFFATLKMTARGFFAVACALQPAESLYL